MIRADMIPDEVVEAAARAAYEIAHKIDCNSDPDQWVDAVNEYKEHWRQQAQAAIAAALNSWPGAFPWTFNGPLEGTGFVIPLPQKDGDA